MKFPHQLYKRAGLNSTDIANLFGVSRVTGARWLSGVDRNGNNGVGVNIFLQDKVERVTAAVRQALDGKELPLEAKVAKPDQRAAKLRSILGVKKPR
jgi:hypothetical protein